MLTDEDKYRLNTDLGSDKYQLNDNFEGFIQGLGLLTRLLCNKGYPVVTINKEGGVYVQHEDLGVYSRRAT